MRLNKRSWAFVLVIVLSTCYSLTELIPGRLALIDEAYFKVAGRNWALTHYFPPGAEGFPRGC